MMLKHPVIDLRLSTNNNRVDVAAEGLDFAIRFGAGAWHGIEAVRLIEAPLSVLCVPGIARQLKTSTDLLQQTLLRSQSHGRVVRVVSGHRPFGPCGIAPQRVNTATGFRRIADNRWSTR